MDGAGSQPELKDLSRAMGFAQRVVTAGFALNVLGHKYNPKSSPKSLIGPAVLEAVGSEWERGESQGKKVADAARYFEDWHLLRKSGSSRTLRRLLDYRPGLGYLDGLDCLLTLDAESVRELGYIPLLGASLAALDSTRAEKKKHPAEVRTELAEGILAAIAARWRPNKDGRIRLPALIIGGIIEPSGETHPEAWQARTLLWDFEFQASADAIRMYPVRYDIGSIDYLYTLVTDANPLPMDALLRWAIDLTSALLATRCLQCAELELDGRERPKRHSSNLAYEAACIEGLACWLLGPKKQELSDQVLCSTVERAQGLLKGERVLRGLWGDLTMGFARKALGWIWPILGTESGHFLRAFMRHSLPTQPIKPTAEGTVISNQLKYLMRPEIAAMPDLAMGVRDEPGRLSYPPSEPSASSHDDWVSVYRRVNRELAVSLARLAERCNAEGRTPQRSEYEALLSKLELGQKELQTKQPPVQIRAKLRGGWHSTRPRRS